MQKKHIKNFIIIFIAIFILELTVFNLNSYRVLNSKNSKTYGKDDFLYIDVDTDENKTLIEIPDVNTEIKTIHLEVKNYDDLDYNILYTDESSAEYRSTPVKKYINEIRNSKYMATFFSRRKPKTCNRITWKKCRVN